MTAALRLRMLPRFPAQIVGADGVKVTRETGSPDLAVSLDFENLGDISGIPNPAENYFAMYNAETDTYVRIPFQSMFDSAGVTTGYPTISAAELTNIPVPIHAILVFGDNTVGDGAGGLFIDTDNGSSITFISGDGRTWYLAKDISEDRLVSALASKINGAMQKAQNLNDVADKASARLNLKLPTYVADRTELKALDTSKDTLATLKEAGRVGEFIFDAANFSAEVAEDTHEIGYVAPASAPTGAGGAWLRNLKLGRIRPEDAGVFGDDVDLPGNLTGMQAAIDFAAREGCVLSLTRGGIYRIPGPIITRSNLYIEREAGAILRPTEWSMYAGGGGQFFGNVFVTADQNEMVQSGVRFDLEIDGSFMPRSTKAYAVSATSNTITLPADFDGKIRAGLSRLTVLLGTGSVQVKRVIAWDAGTRVATIDGTWSIIPDATSFIGEGGNDNAAAFARGISDVIGRVHAYDFPASWCADGSGGKAFNAEQGCRNFHVEVIARRCSWGGFVQGVPGVFPGYSPENQALGNDRRFSRDIRLKVDAQDCECALGVYGATSDSDPTGLGNNNFLKADVLARNCGHATSRPLSTLKNVKSGVVVIAEGANAHIDLYSVIDADFSPVWPAADQPYAGAGMSGGIGAVVQGWGPEITLRGTHVGPVDSLYMLDNARAMGEDAAPSGTPQNVFGFDLNIKHRGSVQPTDGLFWQRNTGGNIAVGEGTLHLSADVDYWPTTVIGADFAYNNIQVDVRARFAGNNEQRGVKGSAAQIRANRNDLSLVSGFYSLDQETFQRGLAIGAGPQILSALVGSLAHDFGSVAAHAEVSTTISVPGAVAGTKTWVLVTFNGANPAGLVWKAQVTAADTVTLYCLNTTAAAVAAGNRTYSVLVLRTA